MKDFLPYLDLIANIVIIIMTVLIVFIQRRIQLKTITEMTTKIESVKSEFLKIQKTDEHEYKIKTDFYDKLSDYHEAILRMDSYVREKKRTKNQSTKTKQVEKQFGDKLSKSSAAFQSYLLAHKDTFLSEYRTKALQLDIDSNQYLEAYTKRDSDNYRLYGSKVSSGIEDLKIDIYKSMNTKF